MSTTHINITCTKCGYHFSQSSYGYQEDPIGMPLMRCPKCGKCSKTTMHSEWIQKGTFGKLYAIAPRLMYCSSVLFIITVFILIGTIFSFESPTDLLFPVIGIIIVVALTYFILVVKVNSLGFMERYAKSIMRTKNDEYRALLEGMGKIYDDSIPKFLILMPSTEELLKFHRSRAARETIVIPTFAESVKNYRG